MLGGYFMKKSPDEEGRAELALFLTSSNDEEYISLSLPMADFADIKDFFDRVKRVRWSFYLLKSIISFSLTQ